MSRKTDAEKLAELREKRSKLRASESQLEAQIKTKAKKAYARKAFLVGDIALKTMDAGKIRELFKGSVTDPKDKALFGLE